MKYITQALLLISFCIPSSIVAGEQKNISYLLEKTATYFPEEE